MNGLCSELSLGYQMASIIQGLVIGSALMGLAWVFLGGRVK